MGVEAMFLVFYATKKQKSQRLSWLLAYLQNVIKHAF